MTPVCIGLGSNLGDRHASLRAAITELSRLPASRLSAVSSIYETDPVDAPPGSPRFLNAAALVETDLPPRELLDNLLQIERRLGRQREPGLRNEPRVIDLDLLFFGQVCMQEPNLTLPHPRMHLRPFVLEPLAEIAPDFRHPSSGKTIRGLLDELHQNAPNRGTA